MFQNSAQWTCLNHCWPKIADFAVQLFLVSHIQQKSCFSKLCCNFKSAIPYLLETFHLRFRMMFLFLLTKNCSIQKLQISRSPTLLPRIAGVHTHTWQLCFHYYMWLTIVLLASYRDLQQVKMDMKNTKQKKKNISPGRWTFWCIKGENETIIWKACSIALVTINTT